MKNFNMKGRHKLWTVILVPLFIFINYRVITFAAKASDPVAKPLVAYLIIVESIIIISFSIMKLFEKGGIIDQINKWADDKF